jgi:SAM-dependent methyltransferase
MSESSERERGAAIFAAADVAASYHGRPPYAPALYEALLALVPGRARALDLGAGPGKVARVLADHFAEVVALDRSAAMLAVGRAEDGGRHPNIAWVEARAEDYEDPSGFDLVTAGASIHWFDPAVLFPKLARWTPILALLNETAVFPHPAPPCGMEAWIGFLNRWRVRMGQPPIAAPPEPLWPPQPGPHEAWMAIGGRERFDFSFRQTVEAFIAGNHARVSWPRAAMGQALADAFDEDLDRLMRPFAIDGVLEVAAVCELAWGRPLAEPRPGGSG